MVKWVKWPLSVNEIKSADHFKSSFVISRPCMQRNPSPLVLQIKDMITSPKHHFIVTTVPMYILSWEPERERERLKRPNDWLKYLVLLVAIKLKKHNISVLLREFLIFWGHHFTRTTPAQVEITNVKSINLHLHF